MIDAHAHILPGLDDGASSWAESLSMARHAAADGITHLVAASHFLEGAYDNTRRRLINVNEELRSRLAKEEIHLEVVPAMEVYLSPSIPSLLEKGSLMTIGDYGEHLLVELPMYDYPRYAEQILFEIMLKGVTPVIAHPERNPTVIQKPQLLEKLVNRGILVQITAGSLMGLYGRSIQRCAEYLVRHGLVHLLGSDSHSSNRPPQLKAAVKRVALIAGEALARDVSIEIPRCVLHAPP